MGKQYLRMALNLFCEFDLLSLVIFTCVISFAFYHQQIPLTSSYVVYVLSYYSILSKKAANLVGFAFKYSSSGYVSLKRVQVG